MSRIRHVPAASLVAALAAAGLIGAVLVPAPALAAPAGPVAARLATASQICTSPTHPVLARRISRGIRAAIRDRHSVVGLAAAAPQFDLTCNLRGGWHFDAASVIKVTILSALLLKIGGPSHLTTQQRRLAWLMITESDNAAAQQLWDEVGMADMQRFLNRARMSHTVLSYAWGLSLLTPRDELTLLRLLIRPGKVLSYRSRRYVLRLMAHVVSYERWGVTAGAPAGVTVHLKNGWLPYPLSYDWHINSIGAFTGVGRPYEIVVLTRGDPTMSYGIQTVQRAAYVINAHLARRLGVRPTITTGLTAQSLLAPGG